VPMVVCCRQNAYLTQKKYLQLNYAVKIQPLSQHQIKAYLLSAGGQLAKLSEVLQEDPMLQELIATPLMLNVVRMAYKEISFENLLGAETPVARQQQVFATYVRHMLQRRGVSSRYTQEQTLSWLTWIAQQMKQRNRTAFSVQQIKHDWLVESLQTKDYEYIGCIGGLLIVLPIGFLLTWQLAKALFSQANIGPNLGWIIFIGLSFIFLSRVVPYLLIKIIENISEPLSNLLEGTDQYIRLRALRAHHRHAGYIPRNCSHFLDYATERILLRKTGPGYYIFIHQLLQNYFASLEVSSPERPPQDHPRSPKNE
jgi:hypothetical protein